MIISNNSVHHQNCMIFFDVSSPRGRQTRSQLLIFSRMFRTFMSHSVAPVATPPLGWERGMLAALTWSEMESVGECLDQMFGYWCMRVGACTRVRDHSTPLTHSTDHITFPNNDFSDLLSGIDFDFVGIVSEHRQVRL